jgi:purine-binding chemotaxis protein CheW
MGLGEANGRRLILVDIDKLMSIRRETTTQRVA